jgi:ELWxxDGT repeat protein
MTRSMENDVDIKFWKTDGTAAGTKSIGVASIDSSYSFSFTKNLVNIGNRFIFPGNYTNQDIPYLWLFDGTSTKPLTRLAVNGFGYDDVGYSFKAYNNTLYFTKQDENGFSLLWKTDGTEGGTKQISKESFFTQLYFKTYKNALYFTTLDSVSNFTICKIEENGTVTVLKRLLSYDFNSNLVEWNDKLYFGAGDSVNGFEIWETNGTELGTKLAFDINRQGSSFPRNLIVVNNTLLFTADDGTTGQELWKISSTGIAESFKNDIKITLYPNPSEDVINVVSEEQDGLNDAKLYNLKGELVKSSIFHEKTATINIQNLPPTTYFIVLESGGKRAVKKFIKVK